MATGPIHGVLDHVRRAALREDEAVCTDGELLSRYLARREEAAFAALVRRHGPMVLGVCRRLLGSHADAEDAFQATFLVLVRKAASVRPRERVANWLHGVACHTAQKVRAGAARRQVKERTAGEMHRPDTPDEAYQELLPLLDRELQRLPERYRVPIVLCELEGKTHQEAARQLGWPVGTVSGRLSRGRALLARRMKRYGAAPPELAPAAVPPVLAAATAKAATAFAAGSAAAAVVSAKVIALAEGTVKTMLLTKLRAITSVLLAVALAATTMGLGGTALARRALAAGQGAAGDAAARPEAGPAEEGKPAAKAVPNAGALESADGKPTVGDQPGTANEGPVQGEAGANPKIQALLQERLEILQKMAADVKRLHQQNAADEQTVRQAELRVYKAELDLYETPKDRIAVLEKIVEVYKVDEDRLSQLMKQGAAAEGTVHEATINRLEAEIALEREKAKPAAPPK